MEPPTKEELQAYALMMQEFRKNMTLKQKIAVWTVYILAAHAITVGIMNVINYFS